MIAWVVVDLADNWEQMIRYESFCHWGMIETVRIEPYPVRPIWLAGWTS